jgi:SNF2 family DNA or RNA helicase
MLSLQTCLNNPLGQKGKLGSPLIILMADHNPSIVFTFWSSTLDLVVKGLTQASIVHTRYDGNTSPANRSLALKNFRQNPDISVILMTISCAAVGYVIVRP